MTCSRCGASGASWITISRSGSSAPIARAALCDGCLNLANVRSVELREEFDALLAAGVGRDRANQLIAKLDGKQATA